MNSRTIEDVSEILDTFNLEEISSLIEKQLDLSENLSVTMTDYFKPLYYHFQQIMNDESTDDELKDSAVGQFHEVCKLFIRIISNKFDLSLNDEWMYNHEGDLPGIANALYCFFVKDLSSNIQEVCMNYIAENKKSIFDIFEDRKNKKDSLTLYQKRNYTIEMAVILANIYDVTTWILSAISEEQYIKYLNQDYIPLRVIYPMLEQDIISGDFVDVISEIYTDNLNLRADVCYQILSIHNNQTDKEE